MENSILKSEKLEDKYQKIIQKYKQSDLIHMSKLLAEVVMGLEHNPCDFLGQVFMNLELGSRDEFTEWPQGNFGRANYLFNSTKRLLCILLMLKAKFKNWDISEYMFMMPTYFQCDKRHLSRCKMLNMSAETMGG